MKANCEQIQTLFQAYVDDELEASHRSIFDSHLVDCTTCQKQWQSFQQLSLALSQLPQVTPPYSIVDRMMPQLVQTPVHRKFIDFSFSRRFQQLLSNRLTWQVAAGTCVASLAFVMIMTTATPSFKSMLSYDQSVSEQSSDSTAPSLYTDSNVAGKKSSASTDQQNEANGNSANAETTNETDEKSLDVAQQTQASDPSNLQASHDPNYKSENAKVFPDATLAVMELLSANGEYVATFNHRQIFILQADTKEALYKSEYIWNSEDVLTFWVWDSDSELTYQIQQDGILHSYRIDVKQRSETIVSEP